MTNVIQELQDLNSPICQLVSKEDTICDVSRKSLRRCPFFAEIFDKEPDLYEVRVEISDNSSAIFQAFLSGFECKRINDVFEVMEFACKIEWADFQAYCARAASGITVPDGTSSDIIVRVVEAIVQFLPIRTTVQYARLVEKCCHKDDLLRRRLFKSVYIILAQRKIVTYAPLDIPFFQLEATVALMEDVQGQSITAILYKGEWLSVNLFGSKFCPFKAQIKRFHLSLGRYVVYQTSEGLVYTKYLLTDTCAKVNFKNSKFFSSRCNQLHVITTNETTNRDELFEWNDQTREFVMQFSHPEHKLSSARRDLVGDLSVELEDGFTINITTGQPNITLNCTDPIGVKYYANNLYEFGPPDRNKASVTLVESVHIGYNSLGVIHVHKGIYQTIVLNENLDGNFIRSGIRLAHKSNLHGKVIAFSDLLLV